MTREKARQVSDLLFKIEYYEALVDEITGMRILEEIAQAYDETVREELIDLAQHKLNKLLKELEEI